VKSWQNREDVDIAVALKDNDFRNYVGKLSITDSLKPDAWDLHKILNADSNFLRSVDIIDYSLLLGEITTPSAELKQQIAEEPELGRGVYCTEDSQYVMGIIDPLTGFSTMKYWEYKIKSVKHGMKQSCIPPQFYAARF